jgi:DNA replication and repair protein RecF
MKINILLLHQFRNFSQVHLSPHPRFNIFFGNNAQGKTNLVEAIYLLSMLKSYRATRNQELIQWGKTVSMIEGRIEKRGIERVYKLSILDKYKKIQVDGKNLRHFKEYFGNLITVVFGPDDLLLSKSGPEYRRRFLDLVIFNSDPTYYNDVNDFEKVLKNRNALCKKIQQGIGVNKEMFEVYNTQFVTHAAEILYHRLKFLDEFKPIFRGIFHEITKSDQDAEVRYESSYLNQDERALTRVDSDPTEFKKRIGEILERTVKESHEKDMRRGFTTVGPHVDDLDMTLDNYSVRSYASQGQHRSFVLALKIAEIQYLKSRLGFYPVFLLDDVSSELDKARNQQLMSYLQNFGGQIFITTTDPAYIRIDADFCKYQIEEGKIIH